MCLHSWEKMTIKEHIFVNQIQGGTPHTQSHTDAAHAAIAENNSMGVTG